jgi:hypothetical protein
VSVNNAQPPSGVAPGMMRPSPRSSFDRDAAALPNHDRSPSPPLFVRNLRLGLVDG